LGGPSCLGKRLGRFWAVGCMDRPLGRFAAGFLCVRAAGTLANATICRFWVCLSQMDSVRVGANGFNPHLWGGRQGFRQGLISVTTKVRKS